MSRGLIVGGPERVREGMERMLTRSGVQELMLSTPVSPLADRLASYRRVAEMFL